MKLSRQSFIAALLAPTLIAKLPLPKEAWLRSMGFEPKYGGWHHTMKKMTITTELVDDLDDTGLRSLVVELLNDAGTKV